MCRLCTKSFHYFILAMFFILFNYRGYAQNTVMDCTHPKEIVITQNALPTSSEKIYYQEADVYTFWYKITADVSKELNFELKSIAKEDRYELLIYVYNDTSFCNDLVYKNLPYSQAGNKGFLHLNKDDIIYLSILHVYGKGCGHVLFLTNENYSFRAIQNICVEEIAATVDEEIEVEKIISINEDTLSNFDESAVVKHTENSSLIKEIKALDSTPKVFENNEKEAIFFKGIVLNSDTKKIIEAELTVTSFNTGNKQMLISKENGFEVEIPNKTTLTIEIKKLGYKTYVDTIDDFSVPISIYMNPVSVGEKIIMHKIYFHPNTAVLKSSAKNELDKLLSFVKENENYKIEIQGHTNGNRKIKKEKSNSHLGEEWNFKGTAKELSQLRAEKIQAYLENNGADKNKLTSKGYGGDKMIIENPKNMKEAMQNIRVEIIVVEIIKL